MARQKGSLKTSSNIEVNVGAPLDARSVVANLEDLTNPDSFPYSYVGMIVSVQQEGYAYILLAKPTTILSNWGKMGIKGDADNLVEGYYNSKTKSFYKDDKYKQLIQGKDHIIYISLDTNKTYRYNISSQTFVRLDEETFQIGNPNTWPVEEEVSFGKGLTGYRWQGDLTPSVINTKINEVIGHVEGNRIISCGGSVNSAYKSIPINTRNENIETLLWIDAINNNLILSYSSNNVTTLHFDIWVTYIEE